MVPNASRTPAMMDTVPVETRKLNHPAIANKSPQHTWHGGRKLIKRDWDRDWLRMLQEVNCTFCNYTPETNIAPKQMPFQKGNQSSNLCQFWEGYLLWSKPTYHSLNLSNVTSSSKHDENHVGHSIRSRSCWVST